MAPLTTLPFGFVMVSSVILPWETWIFTGAAGAMFFAPKAGMELIFATGSAMGLEDVVGLGATGLAVGEPAAADETGTDAAVDPPTAGTLPPGTVTAVVSAPATTVELTVTVAGSPDPELVTVQAVAARPRATSRPAIRARLIGVVRLNTCIVDHPILFVGCRNRKPQGSHAPRAGRAGALSGCVTFAPMVPARL